MSENQNQTDKTDLMDIWSRPGQWARQRAYIFLIINLCVYAALNVLLYWIHQAKFFDFSLASYTVTYHRTIMDILVFPISISEAPVLIPILGMIMAVIIAIPVLVSQLYGFRFSLMFIACILLLAHLPVLSLFMLACSFIAAASKHKLPFKFGVALLSLLPIALYFYVATRGANMLELRPIDPTLLYAPWIFAFLAAAVIAGSVLTVAALIKYRPGGILISMIPFFVIPVILFDRYIGADLLEFRVLAHRFIPGKSMIFTPVDISGRVFESTLKQWRRYKIRNLQTIVDIARFEFPFAAHQLLQKDQLQAINACKIFLRKYPQSQYVPNAMYILGLAKDMRFDYSVLDKKWMVEYHTDFVCKHSRKVWLELANKYPDSIYAQPARLRLAILAVRDENIKWAKALLDELLRYDKLFRNKTTTMPTREITSFRQIFEKPRQVDIPQLNMSDIVNRARMLLELIENNADDPQFHAKPLAEMMKLDPTHPKYRDHLLALAIKYSSSKLHDNLLVEYALQERDPMERKALLMRYVNLFKSTDAGARTLLELAKLEQALGLVNMDRNSYEKAKQHYEMLIKLYPKSVFTDLAKKNLDHLKKMTQIIYE